MTKDYKESHVLQEAESLCQKLSIDKEGTAHSCLVVRENEGKGKRNVEYQLVLKLTEGLEDDESSIGVLPL